MSLPRWPGGLGGRGLSAYYSATGIVVSGNGNVRAAAGALTLGVAGADAGSLTLSGGTSGTVTLQTAAVAGNWTMTLPASDGANGQALVTDGSGITSWAAVGGSGTVNTGNADELAYYSATGTAVVGNSNVRASSGTLTLGDTGSVAGSLALSGSTSGLVTVNVAAAAGTWTLTLPSDDGSANQVLTTDGSGVTSWVSFGSVNSGTANQLAYYSGTGTAVSGNANATVNSGALTLGVAGSAAGSVSLSGATSGTVTVNTAAVAGTWSLTLPASAGTNGYVLTTNGSGTTTWGAASLVVGTSAITSGTSGRILYDNAGSVGEKTVTGTGDVVLATTPLITGLNEKKTAPSISGGTLTLDCSAGNVFSVSLNANITTLTFTNVPTSGTSYALTLSFTADGTGRTITWGASVLWPGGVAPTLTSTNGKVDTFVLYTFDAGTTWYAFTAGQNS